MGSREITGDLACLLQEFYEEPELFLPLVFASAFVPVSVLVFLFLLVFVL